MELAREDKQLCFVSAVVGNNEQSTFYLKPDYKYPKIFMFILLLLRIPRISYILNSRQMFTAFTKDWTTQNHRAKLFRPRVILLKKVT